MRRYARHNGRTAGRRVGMNRLEAAYAELLAKRQAAGEITGFLFETVKFRLAAKTFYEPDFLVFSASGEVEIHEVKGFWEDDARVKIKVFAAMYPFRVYAIRRPGAVWEVEDFTQG